MSDYAYEPMCWMTMNGILTGMDDGTLTPKEKETRAQPILRLSRYQHHLAPISYLRWDILRCFLSAASISLMALTRAEISFSP